MDNEKSFSYIVNLPCPHFKLIGRIKQSSHQTSEIVAYHKVKRKFLNLTEIEKEDPDKLQICEFRGQDFELIED
jgi:hypothetical protein